jgi:4-carboxymuconolactone decarboxylase
LRDASPDLSRYLIEYCFDDIHSCGKLDFKTTAWGVAAALTAMGTAEPQLKVHLHGTCCHRQKSAGGANDRSIR